MGDVYTGEVLIELSKIQIIIMIKSYNLYHSVPKLICVSIQLDHPFNTPRLQTPHGRISTLTIAIKNKINNS